MAENGIRMNNLPSRPLAQVFGIDPDGTVARQDIDPFVQTLLQASGADPAGLPAEVIRAKAAEAVLATQSHVGELLPYATVVGNQANGAGLQYDGQQLNGVVIPPNVTGIGSYVRPFLPLDPAEIAWLAGCTIRIVAYAYITPGFTAAHPLSGEPAAIIDDTGFHQAGTVVGAAQTGDRIAYTIDYTVTGRERYIGVTFAVNSGSAVAAGMAIYIRSLTYRIVADPRFSALGIGGASVPFSRSVLAGEPIGAGYEVTDLAYNVAFASGAVVAPNRGRPLGMTIPAGQTGRTSYIEYIISQDPGELAVLRGTYIRLVMGFNTGATNIAPMDVAIKFDGNGTLQPGQKIIANGQYRQYFYRVVIEGWVPVDAVDLRGTVQIPGSASAVGADTFFSLIEIDARIVALAGGASQGHTYTPADLTARLRASRLMRKAAARAALGTTALRQGSDTTLVLSVDVGGIQDGINAATTRGVNERFQLQVPRGIFTGSNSFDVHLPDHLDLQGWDTGASQIVGYQSPNTALNEVSARSTLNKQTSGRICGVRVTAQNARYALHNDFSNPIFGRGIKQVIEDCHLEHLDNDEVRAYQAANGGDPSQVWRSTAAVGFGLGDGGELEIRRTVMKGKNFPALTGHDGPGLSYAPRLTVEDCTLTSQMDPTQDLGRSFLYGLTGAGQSTIIAMSGNTLAGPIMLGIGPWHLIDYSQQIANKIGGLVWRGSGNSPTPYLLLNDGSVALRIDALAPGAPLAIGGSAVPLIFGSPVPVREAPGLPGGVYGELDVGLHAVGAGLNIANPNLGVRLGDRRGNPVVLNVASGSSGVAVTLDQNYTSSGVAPVIDYINSVIGSFAVASLFVVNDLFRPTFTDEEILIINTGSTTILRKMAVAFDQNHGSGRVMTSADAAQDYAGIAYQTIRPGEVGRVKCAGILRAAQDTRLADGNFSRGDIFGVGGAPGVLTKGAANSFMYATSYLDLKFM